MCAVKKGYKKVDHIAFMRVMGGRKMASQQIKDANAFKTAMSDEFERDKVINFGLPDIEDLEGPAPC